MHHEEPPLRNSLTVDPQKMGSAKCAPLFSMRVLRIAARSRHDEADVLAADCCLLTARCLNAQAGFADVQSSKQIAFSTKQLARLVRTLARQRAMLADRSRMYCA